MKKNKDLNERFIKAYYLINTVQISLINKLIDQVPFGVMLLDEHYIIIHAGNAAAKIFATSASEIKGQYCKNYFKYSGQPNNGPALNSKERIYMREVRCTNNDKYVLHSAFVSDEGSEKVIIEPYP